MTNEADLGVLLFFEPLEVVASVEVRSDPSELLADDCVTRVAVDVAEDDFLGLRNLEMSEF